PLQGSGQGERPRAPADDYPGRCPGLELWRTVGAAGLAVTPSRRADSLAIRLLLPSPAVSLWSASFERWSAGRERARRRRRAWTCRRRPGRADRARLAPVERILIRRAALRASGVRLGRV